MKKLIFGLAALAGAAAGAYFLAKKWGEKGCPFCACDDEEECCTVPFDDCEYTAPEEAAVPAEEETEAAAVPQEKPAK